MLHKVSHFFGREICLYASRLITRSLVELQVHRFDHIIHRQLFGFWITILFEDLDHFLGQLLDLRTVLLPSLG